jgi:TfoX/Sxy family transcriptional regulator of competence genes
MTAELFAHLSEELTGSRPDVEPTRMFGSAGLKTHDRTFAMLVKGRLVVKLPRDRVHESAEVRGRGARVRRAWVRLSAWLSTCCPRS